MADDQWSVKWPGGSALVWNPKTEAWEHSGQTAEPKASDTVEAPTPAKPEADTKAPAAPKPKASPKPPAEPKAKPAPKPPPAPEPKAAAPPPPPPPKPVQKATPPAPPRSQPTEPTESRSVIPVLIGGAITGVLIGYLISNLIR